MGTPPIFCCAKHPVMLRGTAEGESVIPGLSLPLFINPSVTACHLPYILLCKTQGRSVIHVFLYSPMCFLYNNIKHSHLLPLYCCVTRQGERLRFDFVAIAVFQPLCFFNPSVLWTPPLYFAVQNTGEECDTCLSLQFDVFSI